MTRPVIRWTEAQRDHVIETAALAVYNNPKLTKIDALRQAQIEVIPAELHKTDRSIASYGIFMDAVIDALQSNMIDKLEKSLAKPAAEPAPVAEVVADEPWLVAANENLRAGLQQSVDQFVECVTQNIAQKLRAGLEPFIQQMQADTQARMTESIKLLSSSYTLPPVEHTPSPVQDAKPSKKLPRVLVIGTKNSQARILEKDFADLLRLTCKTSTEATALRPANCSYDVILCWTDYLDHTVTRKFKNFKVELVSGGMTSVSEKLLQIALRFEAEPATV